MPLPSGLGHWSVNQISTNNSALYRPALIKKNPPQKETDLR